MSIIIQNMGGPSDGVCEYELRINREVIAKFKHNRMDGLEVCLREAAGAAKRERIRGYLNLAFEDLAREIGPFFSHVKDADAEVEKLLRGE